jgi:UDP-2,3-diacylglucosamine pyrophosphatase LpxH
LHFDKLAHHDFAWLEKEKPGDLGQVRNYSRLTAEILPRLFATVRETISDLNRSPETRVAFTAHVGDLVEGLCGSEKLAVQQDTEALEFVRGAKRGVPFLFAKGNHDITGERAREAFKTVFHPFLGEQTALLNGGDKRTAAYYAFEHGGALLCFFDAYDKESLAWLEATLARRTARHCFVIIHPPVVPYGARSTWHVFSSEREAAQRERLLELLGKNNAFVLTGHIHKYNLLVRGTPRGGKFLQLGLSSIINAADVKPQHLLSGVSSYNPEQVKVEPNFSPDTEKQRRAVYETEAPFVKQFEYADLPGYAVIAVNGPKVTARVFSGVSRQIWRTVELAEAI